MPHKSWCTVMYCVYNTTINMWFLNTCCMCHELLSEHGSIMHDLRVHKCSWLAHCICIKIKQTKKISTCKDKRVSEWINAQRIHMRPHSWPRVLEVRELIICIFLVIKANCIKILWCIDIYLNTYLTLHRCSSIGDAIFKSSFNGL